jgi:hypothetical protein
MKNLKNYVRKNEITLFIKNLKKAGGHVLDIVAVPNGYILLYYREYGDFANNSKTKLFSRM